MFFFLLIALVVGAAAAKQTSPALPNIVIALADDVGFGDVGFTNTKMNLAKTPVLDSLAESTNTWVFNNMRAEAACSPSRIAILTGVTPLRHCVLGAPIDGLTSYNANVTTVVHTMNKHGYRTLFLGKHLPRTGNTSADLPSQFGFQDWTQIAGGVPYDFSCMCRDHVTDYAKNCFLGHNTKAVFLNNPNNKVEGGCMSKSSPHDRNDFPPRFAVEALNLHERFHAWLEKVPKSKNYYAQISFRSVHTPFLGSPEMRDQCARKEICTETKKKRTSIQLDYAACVWSIDLAVGRIRESIRELRPNDYENTIFVFMSDNGPAPNKNIRLPLLGAGNAGGMKGYKDTMFEGLLRVPAMMEWPAMIKQNALIQGLTSIMDLASTFEHIITGKELALQDGVSLLPFLETSNVSFVRPKPLGICDFTSLLEIKANKVCKDIIFYDVTGRWKMVAQRKTAQLKGGQTYTLKANTVKMYDLRVGEKKKSTKGGNKKEMLLQAGEWVDSIFESFRENCVGYY